MTRSPFRTHRTMLMICVVLALVAAWGPARASAQTPLAPAPGSLAGAAPHFTIESIVVEGTSRESVRRIVRRESRLVEGDVYDEEAIALAVRRVKRLPFLLDARPTLRRGSLPGQYQLVIEVEEISVVVASGFGTFSADFASGGISLGANQFLGATTQVSASATVSDRTGPGQGFGRSGQLGFSRYDLFGQASRLHVDGSFGSTEGFNYHVLSAVLRIPVGSNHSVGLLATVQGSTTDIRDFLPSGEPGGTREASSRSRSANADWVFDTTDDPFAAREGLRARAGLGVRSFRSRGFLDRSETGTSASAAVTLTRPLAGNLSAVGGLSADCSEGVLIDGCTSGASGALRLVRAGSRNRYRAFAEAGVSGFLRLDEPDSSFPVRTNGVQLQLIVGLRTRFAVVSFLFREDLE